MRILVATLTVFLLAAPLAHAKPTADESAAAREHYKRGTTLYDLGKYTEAIQEFQQAYEIKDDPVLLYNIAQSFRLSNQYQEALRFYKTYLRRAPKAPNRDEVETKIADMENLIQQQARVATMPSVDAIPPKGDKAANIGAKPARQPGNTGTTQTEPTRVAAVEPRHNDTSTTPPPDNTTTTPPPDNTTTTPPPDNTTTAKTDHKTDETPPAKGGSKTLLIAGIAVAVVGLAILGTGGGLIAVAKSDQSAVEQAPVFDATAASKDSQGKSFGTIGPVLLGVGVAAVAAGVVVAVLGVKKSKEAPVAIAPVIGSHQAGLGLGFAF
jgi:tetratricopeptide (TPR) repeat protein